LFLCRDRAWRAVTKTYKKAKWTLMRSNPDIS
jgi:hypothetical protein